MRFTQTQIKNRREADGVIKFKAVLRYPEANPEYMVKSEEGEDTRTAKQRRKVVYKEVSRSLVAEVVQPSRGVSKRKAEEMTEANVAAALEAWRQEMEAKAAESEAEARKSVPLLDYIEEYVAAREAAQVIEASTATDYRHSAKRLEKRFKGVALKDVTADMMQRWEVSELKRGVSATTVGKVHRLVKQALSHAVKHEVLSKNIMDVVEPPKRVKQKPNGLDVAEARRVTGILMQMGPTPVSTAAFLALHASLRVGECCGLLWSNVDLHRNVIHITQAVGLASGGAYLKQTKNASSTRTVDITEDLAAKLKERREAMHAELRSVGVLMSEEQFNKLYVCGSIAGDMPNPQVMGRKWTAIAEAFNIIGTEGKRASFHTLRHGFATVGIASGVDVASVAAQMGHATVSQTLNTYTSATAEGKRRAARTIGEAMHPTTEQADVFALKTGTEG